MASDEPRTSYVLKQPIAFGSEQITELAFRKPKAKDFRSFPATGQTMSDILTLVSKLCGQPAAVIDELGIEDLAEVSSIVGAFIPAGPATGPTR